MAANCDCIEKTNEALLGAGYNAECKSENCMTGVRAGDPKYAGQAFIIPLRKRDSSKRASLPLMFVKFCPICGKKYGAESKEEAVENT